MKINKVGKKAISTLIVLSFVVGAFAPVMGTQVNEKEMTEDSVQSTVSNNEYLKNSMDSFWQRLNDLFQGFFEVFQDNPFFSLIEQLFSRRSSVSSEDSIEQDKHTFFEEMQDSDNNDPVLLSRDSGDLWWNLDWLYRKEITIDHSMVAGDLLDFPVLIQLSSDADLADDSKCQNSGDDLVFTDSSGSVLSHEIEFFDGGTGELICWVKVPSLSSSVDTVLYMYYGNPSATNQQNPAGVWNDGYVMVQHLEEDGDSFIDSTSVSNDGSNTGTVFNSDCQIDGGREYDNDDFITVNDFTHTPDTLTAEAWVYRNPYDSTQFINVFTEGSHYDASDWILYLRAHQADQMIDFGINNHGSSIRGGNVPEDTWFYLSVVYDSSSSTATVYVNDTVELSGSVSGLINDNYADLGLGNDNDGGQPWNDGGLLDEVRVSNTARNSSWVKTSFYTMSDPTSFFSLSSEEIGITEEPVVSNPVPTDGEANVSITLAELRFSLSDFQNDSMDYTVETSPDIRGGSGSGVGNGTYSVSVSGLLYEPRFEGNRWFLIQHLLMVLPM